MVQINNKHTTYRAIVMKALNYLNKVAFVLMMLMLFVCFSSNNWWFITILVMSSTCLGWLAIQQVTSETDRCKWHLRSLQYDCQIASFNSRLAIVSNVFISVFGLFFAGLTVKYAIGEQNLFDERIGDAGVYVLGFFKLLVLYIIADKIHTTHMLISILMKYSQSMRHLTLDIDPEHPENRYPLIYVDGAQISPNRYNVNTRENNIIGITFFPSLSLGNDSIIEYSLIEEDSDHRVRNDLICDQSDRVTCLFRCRAIVKKLKLPPITMAQQP